MWKLGGAEGRPGEGVHWNGAVGVESPKREGVAGGEGMCAEGRVPPRVYTEETGKIGDGAGG